MRRGGLALALAVALVATAATGAAATSFTGNAGKAGDTFAKCVEGGRSEVREEQECRVLHTSRRRE